MISYWADCCTFRIKTKIIKMEASIVKTSRETTPKTWKNL